MANFETNQWYQLSVAASDEMSLLGTSIYNTTTWTGASFFNYTNTNASSYRWQIFPINSSTYALRSGDSGPKSFLGTAWAKSETYPGATRSLIVQNNVSDESVYWNIKPWGDGTFYMTNAANGSSWHLGWHNGLAILDSNITEPQPGQSWSFKPIKNATIDDSAYSSVNVSSQAAKFRGASSDLTTASQRYSDHFLNRISYRCSIYYIHKHVFFIRRSLYSRESRHRSWNWGRCSYRACGSRSLLVATKKREECATAIPLWRCWLPAAATGDGFDSTARVGLNTSWWCCSQVRNVSRQQCQT